MDEDYAWYIELDETTGMYVPTLIGNGCAFSLPIHFGTTQQCERFIELIPAGQS